MKNIILISTIQPSGKLTKIIITVGPLLTRISQYFWKINWNIWTFQKKKNLTFLNIGSGFQPGFVYSMSFKFNEEFEPYAQLNFKIQPKQLFRMFMEAHQLPLWTTVTYSSEQPDKWNHLLLKKAERNGDFIAIERWGKLDKIQ